MALSYLIYIWPCLTRAPKILKRHVNYHHIHASNTVQPQASTLDDIITAPFPLDEADCCDAVPVAWLWLKVDVTVDPTTGVVPPTLFVGPDAVGTLWLKAVEVDVRVLDVVLAVFVPKLSVACNTAV